MNIEIFKYESIRPFKILGLTGDFWTIHIDTLIYTWAAMAVLLILSLIGWRAIKNRDMNYSLVSVESAIGFFIDLCKESFPVFNYNHFAFILSLFYFTLACCLIGLIPGLDEATKDLNTTLAIGLTSFIYVQYEIIKAHGVFGFLKDLAQPFLLLMPVNIVGELSRIASMSFRLFGNILGGSIIFSMMVNVFENFALYFIFYVIAVLIFSWFTEKYNLFSRYKKIRAAIKWSVAAVYLLPFAQMFFGIFEGVIQAFVLTMLTTVYLSMGLGSHDSTEHAVKHEHEEI
ncbi:MAG: FoF1 ATP synthase subunit a [bacterium]